MTIIVPEELENSIHAAVQSGHFASVDDAMTEAARLLLQQLQERQASAPPEASQDAHADVDSRPIWEVFQEISAGVPEQVWEAVPTDLSEEHDHYIYGTPKRSER
jgi:Arc/MetJ-type ribon-helix-helix transcriptional regulator